jgi:hypothetical protein
MVGEGQYRRTAHWIGVREPAINSKFIAAVSLDVKDKQNHLYGCARFLYGDWCALVVMGPRDRYLEVVVALVAVRLP